MNAETYRRIKADPEAYERYKARRRANSRAARERLKADPVKYAEHLRKVRERMAERKAADPERHAEELRRAAGRRRANRAAAREQAGLKPYERAEVKPEWTEPDPLPTKAEHWLAAAKMAARLAAAKYKEAE